MPRPHSTRGALAVIVIGATMLLAGQILPAMPASAAGQGATIRMPFDGWWDRYSVAHPSYHGPAGNNYADWAVDIYEAAGTTVRANFGGANTTMKVASIAATCGSAGQTVRLDIHTNGQFVGTARYGHLSNVSVSVDQWFGSGTALGELAQYPYQAGCWEVSSSGGVHTHVTGYNLADYSCYIDVGSGSRLAAGTPIGVVGGAYGSRAQQECTGVPNETPPAPPAPAPAPPAPAPAPPPPAPAPPAPPSTGGIPHRIDGLDPADLSVRVSELRFPSNRGGARPDHVVLASSTTFADALAGSPLIGDAPLLFVDDALAFAVTTEIRRLLGSGGEVIVLGGPAAISVDVEEDLVRRGHDVIRLAGSTRLETATAIADFLGERPDRVYIARAFGDGGVESRAWADAITGGALAADTGAPLLLSQSDILSNSTSDHLDTIPRAAIVLLGGTAALGPDVAAAVGPHQRLQGSNRYDTAIAITEERDDLGDTTVVFNGEINHGWQAGLLAIGLAHDRRASLLPVSTRSLPDQIERWLTDAGCTHSTIVGPEDDVADSVADDLEDICS